MTLGAKDMMRRLALTVYRDPTATTREKQLSRALLLLVDGRLPQ